MNIYLQVPFDEKDEAKQLGARWDARLKKWFVPEGADPEAFVEWMPQDCEFLRDPPWARMAHRVPRAPRVLLLAQHCWNCERLGYAIALSLHMRNDELPEHLPSDTTFMLEHDFACVNECKGGLGTHEGLVRQLARYLETSCLQLIVATFKPRFSKTIQREYMSQGCPHCDALWGDFPLSELAFERASQIVGQQYDENVVFAFELAVGRKETRAPTSNGCD